MPSKTCPKDILEIIDTLLNPKFIYIFLSEDNCFKVWAKHTGPFFYNWQYLNYLMNQFKFTKDLKISLLNF